MKGSTTQPLPSSTQKLAEATHTFILCVLNSSTGCSTSQSVVSYQVTNLERDRKELRPQSPVPAASFPFPLNSEKTVFVQGHSEVEVSPFILCSPPKSLFL